MGRPSKYPEEFRREAVAVALSTEESRAAVARRLGVNETTLRNWVADHLAEEARQADPLAVTAPRSSRSCGGCAARSPSCAPSGRSCARQPPISPRRRSGLPLPVRRRAPTRLRRQAALSGLGGLTVGVLRLARPAAVGAVGERRGARRGDRGDPRAVATEPMGAPGAGRAGSPRAALWPQTGRPPDAIPSSWWVCMPAGVGGGAGPTPRPAPDLVSATSTPPAPIGCGRRT